MKTALRMGLVHQLVYAGNPVIMPMMTIYAFRDEGSFQRVRSFLLKSRRGFHANV